MTSLIERLRDHVAALERGKAFGGPSFQLTCAYVEEAATAIESLTQALQREESGHLQTIDARDEAEEAVSQAYYVVVGRSPEWSNLFGYPQALEEIGETVAALKTYASTLTLANKALREALERAIVRPRAALLIGGRVIPNGSFCTLCGESTDEGTPLVHEQSCALSSPPPSPSQERDRVIEECAQHIRHECVACEGTGHADPSTECEYCGRPMESIKRLKSAGLTKEGIDP